MRDRNRKNVNATGRHRVYSVQAKSRRSWLGVTAVAVVVIVGVVQWLGERGDDGLQVAPAEIVGSWMTTDARFTDRGFTITEDSVGLRFGDGANATFLIRSIVLDTAAVHNAYRITYERATETEVLEVYAYADSTIRLRNPAEVIWRRERN